MSRGCHSLTNLSHPRHWGKALRISRHWTCRDVLLTHAVRCPLSLSTPAEEGVVCLGLHPPGPHLLGKPVGRREGERVSSLEEVYGPGGFVAATTTVEVAEHMACEWVSVGWCSALWDVVGGTPVLGLRLVCRLVLGRVDGLPLIAPLGRSNILFVWWPTGWAIVAPQAGGAVSLWVLVMRNISNDALELVECRLLDVEAVGGNPDGLVGVKRQSISRRLIWA